MEVDSDEDTETQLHDIKQLNAVLAADENSTSDHFSQASNSHASIHTLASKSFTEYGKIEKALSLNKLTDEKLRRLESMLTKKYQECKQKLSEVRKVIQNKHFPIREKQDVSRVINCGRPYFRDSLGFTPPDNFDTILMEKSEMYDFSQITTIPGWTVKDKNQMSIELLKMSQDVRKNEIKTKIAKLVRESKSKENKNTKKIEQLKAEIELLSKKTLQEIALPLDKDYDWETLANKCSGRHTPQEYASLWKLFLHPSINKNTWSKAEHLSLQKIVFANNFQDWDDIALKLNTGRTGYQCFIYYRTNITSSHNGKKWTVEEIEYLKRLIEYYKEDNFIPWGKVAAAMENRTKIQVYNKYTSLIAGRKGRFLPEEDAVILNCFNKFGADFKRICKFLPGRTMVQIRNRYTLLCKRNVSMVWTTEEDKKLVQIMANQDMDINFASIIEHFPGKDRVHLRSRYITLVKWMKKHPQRDVSEAPRRGARRLPHGSPKDDLNKALEDLKSRMQSEVETKKNRRITIQSPDKDIENAIIAALVTDEVTNQNNEDSKADELEVILHDNSVVSAENLNMTNMKKTLLMLSASLNKSDFCNSSYSSKYSSLLNNEQEVNLVKIKSYSKKDKLRTIKLNDAPDIWGNITLSNLQYVLPPNYATITGCRSIINYIKKETGDSVDINLNLLMRKNVLFRGQVNLLMERLNTLFTWPMLLSNEGPDQTLLCSIPNVSNTLQSYNEDSADDT